MSLPGTPAILRSAREAMQLDNSPKSPQLSLKSTRSDLSSSGSLASGGRARASLQYYGPIPTTIGSGSPLAQSPLSSPVASPKVNRYNAMPSPMMRRALESALEDKLRAGRPHIMEGLRKIWTATSPSRLHISYDAEEDVDGGNMWPVDADVTFTNPAYQAPSKVFVNPLYEPMQ